MLSSFFSSAVKYKLCHPATYIRTFTVTFLIRTWEMLQKCAFQVSFRINMYYAFLSKGNDRKRPCQQFSRELVCNNTSIFSWSLQKSAITMMHACIFFCLIERETGVEAWNIHFLSSHNRRSRESKGQHQESKAVRWEPQNDFKIATFLSISPPTFKHLWRF